MVLEDVAHNQRAVAADEDLMVFAHEVANRLDGALRCVSLARRGNDEARNEQSLRRAEESLLSLASLTRTALRGVGIDAIADSSRPQSLREGIELAARSVEPVCAERRINMSLDIDSLPNELLAHGLPSVVLNGLWNAIEAIDREGEVRIKASLEDGRIVIEITDTGPGVEAGSLEEIIEKNPIGSRGRGIGLRHAKAIVEAMGGTISLANQEMTAGAILRADVPAASCKKAGAS